VSQLNDPNKPAVAVAVLKDGKLIYEKAFGSADLEHRVPATVDTKFLANIFAGEFIAFATLLLEEQGKISLNDDIRHYLPELPDFGKKISIRHLLSSTDGLHGYKVLQSLAGWMPKKAEQSDAILHLIKNQKRVNFNPGEDFSPSGDTRLLLLVKIVEKVSGLSFDAYCQSQLFAPLGMSNSVFLTENTPRLTKLALPYRDDGKGSYKYDDASATEPINLYTSIRDLSIWKLNLSYNKLGSQSLTEKLKQPIHLDNGQRIKNSGGIANYGQEIASIERGIPKFYLLGTNGGYANSFFRFPEQEFTVMVLSSGLAYNGSYGMQIAYSQLESHFPEPKTIDYTKIASVKLSPAQLQKYEGNFWSPARTFAAKIYLKNGILHYSRMGTSIERVLIPLGDSVFQMQIEGDDHFLIRFVDKADGRALHFTIGKSDPVVLEAYQPVVYTKNSLTPFTGLFYSKELNTSYVVETKGDMLTAHNLRTGTTNLTSIHTDIFSGDKSFLGGIRFIRGDKNELIGFQVLVDGGRHVEFRRVRT
jgi:CubicO group peptidase (beta-lactamase class C family)